MWLGVNAHHHDSYASSVAALIISGIGTSMAMPAQQSAVMTSVPPQSMGKAGGTFSTVRQLGGALGIAVLAAVFAAHGSDRSPEQFADGFSAAIITSAVLAFVGAASGILAPGRAPSAPQTAQHPAAHTSQEELGVR